MGGGAESQQSPMMIEYEKMCETTEVFIYQLRVPIKKMFSVMQVLNLG